MFSDVRISNRLDEIDKWRKTLEYTIAEVDQELHAVQSTKAQCERYLEHMKSPLGNEEKLDRSLEFVDFSLSSDISLENAVTRDGRKAIDNVDDEVERELKKVDDFYLQISS